MPFDLTYTVWPITSPATFSIGQQLSHGLQMERKLLNNVVDLATRYGLGGPRIESRGGARAHPAPLHKGYRSIPGGKAVPIQRRG